MRHLTDVRDLGAQVRAHELVEVLVLERLAHLSGDLQPQAGLDRGPDSAMRSLVGTHPSEEDEVVASMRCERVVVEVQRVRTVGDPVQVRTRPALVQRDRDQTHLGRERGELRVHESVDAVERAVDGVHERRPQSASGHRGQEAAVVVDQVEVVRFREAVQDVPDVGRRLPDLLARSLLVDVVEHCLRPRLPRREQRHLVAGVDETVGEEPDDPLDPAVARGRHREPGRREQCDPHLGLLHPHVSLLDVDVP